MDYDKSLFGSFKYALEGVKHAYKYNRNLRLAVFIASLVILLGLFFQVTSLEMVILVVTILLVILSEMINTSLEEMVDLITQEHRKEAKIAKDVAAGMVLTATIGAVIVGIFIFTPYISKLFY